MPPRGSAPHRLRHACCFALVCHGADTRWIQDDLGHRNMQHTVRDTATNPARFERLWREVNETRYARRKLAPHRGRSFPFCTHRCRALYSCRLASSKPHHVRDSVRVLHTAGHVGCLAEICVMDDPRPSSPEERASVRRRAPEWVSQGQRGSIMDHPPGSVPANGARRSWRS